MSSSEQRAAGRFSGRVALVSGAGTGIGAATCRQLVDEGARVVLTGRREAPLKAVAEEFADAALVAAGDAADAADVRRAAQRAREAFGPIDTVIANAGAHKVGRAGDLNDADWQFTLHANLDTDFVTLSELLPSLTERHGSAVIVSSLAGLFAGPDVVGYATTKHELIGLTRSIARDYGRYGVRVNAVCPGWVRTEMADEQMDDLASMHGLDREQAYQLAASNTPLQRPVGPDEIAKVIAFLASSDASAITGTYLLADSGASCVDLPTVAFAQDS
jgi:NAD(P)-dependent dehydrogenase (short-subunit alcohol dehydrogenase family)